MTAKMPAVKMPAVKMPAVKMSEQISRGSRPWVAVSICVAIGVMIAGGFGVVAETVAAETAAAQTAVASKPNVVLVITDDQGYGDLSCYGNPVLKTPNLDQMFAQSVRLTDFHVAPTCSPTRAGLMTGRYCDRTGVWHTIMGRSLLRRGEVTMADVFAAAGYRTGIFGKWHLGDNYPFRPQDRGFAVSLVHKGGGVGNAQDHWGNDYFDDTYFRNGTPEKFDGYCTDIWFDGALKFIEENKDRPFFCYLSTNAPHGPYRVPPKYSQPYKDQGVAETLANYYGMVASIDENFGRLAARLDEMGLAENTIFIFMTDNGATPAGRRRGDFNAAMRGFKGSQYDGGHRVPLFIRWPARGLTGGRDVDRLTANVDLLPTLIELCELTKPEGVEFDGTSIVPLLTGQATDWPDRTLVVDNQRLDFLTKNRRPAVMTDRWRLVNGSELYDIEQDPGQRRNLAREYPDVVERLAADYEKWWTSVSANAGDYPRIVIGADEENPTVLTTHDVHGAVVWNQGQVRSGRHTDGFWAIDVDRDGEYEFALRRWPAELGAAITEAADGGRAIRATSARLKVGDFDGTKLIGQGAPAVTFRVPLGSGHTRLQAWFIDGRNDGQTNGVYFVEAKRLD